MLTWISKLYWKVNGWKIVGSLDPQYKKFLMVIAPHTHWTDILIGFAARDLLNIQHAKFLGKKELFEGFGGKILLKMGGIPVDRHGKLGLVEQVKEYYDTHDEYIIGIAPEGTRKRVDSLKTGFYHMAKTANVPIVLVGFDFKDKEVILKDAFYVSDDEEADIKEIIRFFSTIHGAKPEYDMTHLHGKV